MTTTQKLWLKSGHQRRLCPKSCSCNAKIKVAFCGNWRNAADIKAFLLGTPRMTFQVVWQLQLHTPISKECHTRSSQLPLQISIQQLYFHGDFINDFNFVLLCLVASYQLPHVEIKTPPLRQVVVVLELDRLFDTFRNYSECQYDYCQLRNELKLT